MKTNILVLRTLAFFFLVLSSSSVHSFADSENTHNREKTVSFVQEIEQAEHEPSDSRISTPTYSPSLKRSGHTCTMWSVLSTYKENIERSYFQDSQLIFPTLDTTQIIFPFHTFF